MALIVGVNLLVSTQTSLSQGASPGCLIQNVTPLQHFIGSISVVWEETTQCQGENNLKGLEGTIPEIYTGLEIVCVSISQSGKAPNSWVVRQGPQKTFISAEQKITPKHCSDSE